MEVRLQKAMERKKAEELRASTEQLLPRFILRFVVFNRE